MDIDVWSLSGANPPSALSKQKLWSLPGRVVFKYVFVFQYKNFGVFEVKITKGHIFVFDVWSVFEMYLQIQSNTHKTLPFYQQNVKHSMASTGSGV